MSTAILVFPNSGTLPKFVFQSLHKYIEKLVELVIRTIPEKANELAASLPDEDEKIMVYKYMPDAFLDKQ